jgi:hypothetical protein
MRPSDPRGVRMLAGAFRPKRLSACTAGAIMEDWHTSMYSERFSLAVPAQLHLPGGSWSLGYAIDLQRLFMQDEINAFISLYEASSTNEREIHRFLREHPKFLYLLGPYEQAIAEFQVSGTRGRRLRTDFLLQHCTEHCDLLEVKLPTKPLAAGPENRRHFSQAVIEATAQVRTYIAALTNEKDNLRAHNITIAHPLAHILIGRDEALAPEERRALEAELPRNVRIVTYDDLTRSAEERRLVIAAYSLPTAFGLAPRHPWKTSVQHVLTVARDMKRSTYLGGPPWEQLVAAITSPIDETLASNTGGVAQRFVTTTQIDEYLAELAHTWNVAIPAPAQEGQWKSLVDRIVWDVFPGDGTCTNCDAPTDHAGRGRGDYRILQCRANPKHLDYVY